MFSYISIEFQYKKNFRENYDIYLHSRCRSHILKWHVTNHMLPIRVMSTFPVFNWMVIPTMISLIFKIIQSSWFHNVFKLCVDNQYLMKIYLIWKLQLNRLFSGWTILTCNDTQMQYLPSQCIYIYSMRRKSFCFPELLRVQWS